ncbi:conserved hypothetical protein [Vibrio nigripulchritudo SO65]|uniref:hypothetical protein n=1 Tax=Vibrio nigripulchritudo TaxID=28173 RepID=UPI0003B21593|nr:hypothetical protein [Vibrio nigripulchritudo]CCN38658.1 conserved hypothetical protein [Vibrio nigripulchritudo AM115]CCN44967.1 conserved hypothetical protein [Vibrio nigripulchritudo FTn2]CCN79725.1 conserved hypothetical protein [Vibrio nigripulchritudo SO65]
MSKDSKANQLTALGNAVKVQRHQLTSGASQLSIIDNKLDELNQDQTNLNQALSDAINQVESMLGGDVHKFSDPSTISLEDNSTHRLTGPIETIEQIDYVNVTQAESFETIVELNDAYAQRQGLDLTSDPYKDLMSVSERIEFEKWVREDFTYQNADCDKYDYLIASTCGLLGGLIDVLLVIAPGEGLAGKFSDEMTNKAVEKFAQLNGWKGPKENSDPTASAIGFLERNFKINYDHRHGGDVDHLFKMSTRNHHIKSLGHSPDLVGLFFSILNQFTNTASFIADGKLVTIDTNDFELQGSDFVSKLFCGFANWLGHVFSDVAGSSGSVTRGSGIPIPFFSLFQLMDIGEFGKHKQSFATMAVKVFEQGYDARHGAAMAIPVVITELMTRIMWTVKRRFYHKLDWSECIPSASIPELRRMLLVSHGALCAIDTVDASLKSGGTVIGFMKHTNIIAYARFGVLAVKEIKAWYAVGKIDPEKVDAYLDQELAKMV